MSKMRTPRKRSMLTAPGAPCVPQSMRPRVSSTDMNSRSPIHRHVTLAAWADERAREHRFGRIRDVVDLEAVEAADDGVVLREGEVRVDEAEVAGRRVERRRRAGRCRPARCSMRLRSTGSSRAPARPAGPAGRHPRWAPSPGSGAQLLRRQGDETRDHGRLTTLSDPQVVCRSSRPRPPFQANVVHVGLPLPTQRAAACCAPMSRRMIALGVAGALAVAHRV